MIKHLARVLLPLISVGLCFLLMQYLDADQHKYLIFLIWIGLTLFINRTLEFILLRCGLKNLTKRIIPRFAMDFLASVIWLISFAVYLKTALDVDLTALVATTSVSVVVLGIALRSLVLDFFAGLTLSMESPYEVGDWIEASRDIVGQVVDMNWRVTRIVTSDNYLVCIPNSKLASASFKNYSKPTRYFRESVSVILDYDITAYQAERLLLSAANKVKEVAEAPKKPTVRIADIEGDGVRWVLKFWVSSYEERDRFKYEIQKNLLKNLYLSAIRPSNRELNVTLLKEDKLRNRNSGMLNFLKMLDIFKALTDQELKRLADSAVREVHIKGRKIVNQGEEGDSFYILAEGLLKVYIRDERGKDQEIARIGPGSCFGEMSLLTGAPRSATVQAEIDSVVYLITRENLLPIMEANAKLVHNLGELLAERQLENETLNKIWELDGHAEGDSLKNAIIRRIFEFFGLSQHQ